MEAFSFPATTATLSKFNRISYGTTAKEQTDYFKNVKDTSVEVARFLFNFVPFLSDGIDFGTQVINAATGQNVDNVLLVMASAGLILDATTGGVGDVTAIFKAVYKESRSKRVGWAMPTILGLTRYSAMNYRCFSERSPHNNLVKPGLAECLKPEGKPGFPVLGLASGNEWWAVPTLQWGYWSRESVLPC